MAKSIIMTKKELEAEVMRLRNLEIIAKKEAELKGNLPKVEKIEGDTIPLVPFKALPMVIEPSFDNVTLEKDYSPKEGLILSFNKGQEAKKERIKLVKWFSVNGYSRSREHHVELGLKVEKNAFQLMFSWFEENGWPKQTRESVEVFVSIETAKKQLGKHNPAVLYCQSFMSWLSNNYIGWKDREETLKQAQIKAKEVRQDDSTAVQELLNKVAATNTPDPVKSDLPKTNLSSSVPTLVKVPELAMSQVQKLQREVLRTIILSPDYTEKAKRLSQDLLSELGLAEIR